MFTGQGSLEWQEVAKSLSNTASFHHNEISLLQLHKGPEVQMGQWAGDTDANRGIGQGKGLIVAKMSSCMCPGGEQELFGYLAILWQCVKEGLANHACKLTEKLCPGSMCMFSEASPLTLLQNSQRDWVALGQDTLTHICLRNKFVSSLGCHC